MAKPNREMRRSLTKKSHSWWWDSHISPKNSKWLAENLEEMDQSVNRMLKLIEADADSFAKRADMYYQKRPELIAQVEDFYRRYRSLAERYDHVTGELCKNIPSELQSPGSGSEFGSEPPTPERKAARRRSRHRAAGFDFFLGSGGSSDLSRKGTDRSSSSSGSDLESDEATPKNHVSGRAENGDKESILLKRILELETELKVMTEKLMRTEAKDSNKTALDASENGNYDELQSRNMELEQQLATTNEKLRVSEEEIARLKCEIENKIMGTETENSTKALLEASENDHYDELRQQLTETNEKLQVSVEEVERLKYEIGNNRSSETISSSLKVSENGHYDELQLKIVELEQQLAVANEKLQVSEREIERLKCELENNRSSETVSPLESELNLSLEQKKLLEIELELARKGIESCEAELQLTSDKGKQLETEMWLEKTRKSELEERVLRLEAEVAAHERIVEEMRVALTDVTNKYSKEKSELEAQVSMLWEKCLVLESKFMEVELRGQSPTDKIVQLEADKAQLHDAIERAKVDSVDPCKRVEELNRNLDELKLKYDQLKIEKDEVSSMVLVLVGDVSSRDNQINEMDKHLHRLHLEHTRLIEGGGNAQKLVKELTVKVKELEEEVERQRLIIADNAEAKREAIRQLCFSLEHYRDGYFQLRQALNGHKRRTVMVS